MAVRVRARGRAAALIQIGGRVVPLFEGRFVDP
jgi:hypothetical protein